MEVNGTKNTVHTDPGQEVEPAIALGLIMRSFFIFFQADFVLVGDFFLLRHLLQMSKRASSR